MDGILALDLWDLVIEVFHSSLHPPSIQGNRCCNEQSGKRSKTRTKERPIRDDLRLTNVDHVTSNAQRSSNQDDYKRQKSDNVTMCPVPTELRLIGYLTESIWTQNQNQICWYQKPTCRHPDERAVSLVKSGTIFLRLFNNMDISQFASAISAQPALLRPCRKDRRLSIGLQQRWVRVRLTAWDTDSKELEFGSPWYGETSSQKV